MPQNAQQFLPALNPSNVPAPTRVDTVGSLLTGKGASRSLGVSANTVIKLGAGRVCKVNVLVAGAVGQLYDFATVAGVSQATQIAAIPAVVGSYDIDFPFATGLVYTPGASQVISISYT